MGRGAQAGRHPHIPTLAPDRQPTVKWAPAGTFGSGCAPVVAVTAGFVPAVLGRVQVETGRDPTSHNLWPLEVIIAGEIGLAAPVIG